MIFHFVQELEPGNMVMVAFVAVASVRISKASCGIVADDVGKVLA